MSDPNAVLAEARRLLRPGRTLVACCVSSEGVPLWRLLRAGWRLVRRWGPIPGRRDLTQEDLWKLVSGAGFAAIDLRLIRGRAMNAVFATAIQPGLEDTAVGRVA